MTEQAKGNSQPEYKSTSSPLQSKYLYWVIGGLIGAVGGYFYWLYWGCNGSCAITSVWWRTSIWGAVMGGLLADSLFGWLNKKDSQGQDI